MCEEKNEKEREQPKLANRAKRKDSWITLSLYVCGWLMRLSQANKWRSTHIHSVFVYDYQYWIYTLNGWWATAHYDIYVSQLTISIVPGADKRSRARTHIAQKSIRISRIGTQGSSVILDLFVSGMPPIHSFNCIAYKEKQVIAFE